MITVSYQLKVNWDRKAVEIPRNEDMKLKFLRRSLPSLYRVSLFVELSTRAWDWVIKTWLFVVGGLVYLSRTLAPSWWGKTCSITWGNVRGAGAGESLVCRRRAKKEAKKGNFLNPSGLSFYCRPYKSQLYDFQRSNLLLFRFLDGYTFYSIRFKSHTPMTRPAFIVPLQRKTLHFSSCSWLDLLYLVSLFSEQIALVHS